MEFQELINTVRQIPYGRNSNRYDFSLVLSENRGTCSSKHAFLKDFADKNQIPNVKLIVGIYKMTEQNTNNGNILSQHSIDYIPEAHCYLKIDDNVVDVTSMNSDFNKIKNDILDEIEIQPNQVIDYKINYHQNFIKNWLTQIHSNYSFEEIWKIREECISELSKNSI
jgi:hypothetical protein